MGLLVLGALWMLDGEWLRRELEVRLGESLNATVRINQVEFSPLSGTASVRDVQVRRDQPDSELAVDLREGRIELSLFGLLFRSVRCKHLELDGLAVESVSRVTPKPSGSTMDKLKAMAKEKWEDLAADTPMKWNRPDFRIDTLVIGDATFAYRREQEDARPFVLKLAEVEYTASDVSVHSLYRLLRGAELKARVEEPGGRLVKTDGTLEVTGVPLAGIDPYFDQADALVVAGGEMDLATGKGSLVRVVTRGMKVASNPEAKSQEFAFVPVDRIIRYVEGKEGDLDLEFDIETGSSEDLEALGREAWKGLWVAILQEVLPDGEAR